MSRVRHILIPLAAIALVLLTMGVVAAQSAAKPANEPARVRWAPARVTLDVLPGQTTKITAVVVSNVDVKEATLLVPGELAKLLKADQPKLVNLKAGVPTTVLFTVTMPATKPHAQSGVVRVRAGQRELAEPLQVFLNVKKPGAGAAKPEPPRAPLPTPTTQPTAAPQPAPRPEPTSSPLPTMQPTAAPPAYPAPQI